MATMGSLIASLKLNSAAFRRDLGAAAKAVNTQTAQMKRSMRQVEQASRRVQRQFGQLKGAAVALAGALAVRQFARFSQQALSSAAALSDMSRTVGISAERLQEFRFAAVQSSISIRDMETSLRALSRRQGEALRGNKTFLKGFQQLGITVEDLRRIRPEELVLEIADGVRRLGSQAQRIAALDAVMSETGRRLVTVFQDGREGLEAFGESARNFGAVMTNEVVAKGKLADDSLTSLSEAFRTAFDTGIIEQLAGSMTVAQGTFQQAADAGRSFGEAVGTAMRGVAAAAKFVAENMREIVAVITTIVSFKFAKIVFGIGAAMIDLALKAKAAKTAIGALTIVMQANPVGLLATAAGAAAGAWVLFADNTAEASNATKTLNRIQERNQTLTQNITSLTRDQAKARLEDAVATRQQINAEIELTRAELARQNANLDRSKSLKGSARFSGLREAGESATAEQLEKLGAEAAKNTEIMAKLIGQINAGASATKRFGQSQSDAADAVKETAASLVQQFSQANLLRKATEEGDVAIRRHNTLVRVQAALIDAKLIPAEQTLLETKKLLRETDDSRIKSIAEIIEATEKEARATEKLVDEQKKAEKKAEDLADEQKRRAEEVERTLRQPFENFIESTQRATADMFENIFSNGVDSFGDLFDTVKRLAVRFAGEMASLLVFRPSVVAQAGGFFGIPGLGGAAGGAGATGGAGGAAGIGANLGSLAGTASGITSFGAGSGSGLLQGAAGLSAIGSLLTGGSLTGGSSLAGSAFGQVGSLFASGNAAAQAGTVSTFIDAGLNFSSPAGIFGGIAGSQLASLLGIGGQNIGGQIGGTIGSIAGSFIPVPFVGTAIGSFAGSVLGDLVGGLFGFGGGKPSTDTASGLSRLFLDAQGQIAGSSGLTAFGGSAPTSVTDQAAALLREIQAESGIDIAGSLVNKFGGAGSVDMTEFARVFTGGFGRSTPGFRTGQGLIDTADPEELVKGVTAGSILQAAGITTTGRDGPTTLPRFLTENLPEGFDDGIIETFDKTIEVLDEFIERRKALQEFLDEGVANFEESIFRQARQEISELTTNIAEFIDEVDSLGLSADRAREIAGRRLREVFGFIETEANETSEVQRALKSLEARFDAASDLFEEFGISAEDAAARLDAAKNEVIAGFEDSIRDQILAITDPAKLALEELEQAQQRRIDNAQELGVSLVEIERLNALERQQVLERFGSRAASSLQSFLDEITFGSLSGASPQATLAGTRARFEATAAQAMAGDVGARGRIQDQAQAFIEASRAFFASSGGFQSDLSRVQDVVAQLIADAPGFAHGTSNAPAGLGIVGENGPELVQFRGGEQVIPANTDMIVGAVNSVGGEIARGNAAMQSELRALRKEVEAQGEELERLRKQMRAA